MKGYLSTDELTTVEKKTLFKMRVRMCPNKTNFKSMYKSDLTCLLCQDQSSLESESHLLECEYLHSINDLSEDIKKVEYQDIFGSIEEQIKAAKVWTKVFKIYEKQKGKLS